MRRNRRGKGVPIFELTLPTETIDEFRCLREFGMKIALYVSTKNEGSRLALSPASCQQVLQNCNTLTMEPFCDRWSEGLFFRGN